ncbi:hypothetical protein Val02_56020 [Virgisporangium aliadipatigenens]|uniref:Uncharacterized protein n=1 Tax=Virgisporangium aliadipatigenens TaxID=741659 RepID=A0A8J4DT12_9ACTN|nr:hypothetical protein Val02_56020 [Virgisporangium aliadipatigenens]
MPVPDRIARRVLGMVGESLQPAGEYRIPQRLPRREVPVHRADADSREAGDILDRSGGTLGGEHRLGGDEDSNSVTKRVGAQ